MTASVRLALREAWTALASGPSGETQWRALRLEGGDALEVFAAIRERDGARCILFECPLTSTPKWRMRFESEGLLLLDERDPQEELRRIVLVLERGDLESIFPVVAEDLVEASQAASDAESALSALGERLSAWQTCLRLRKTGFSRESMLGLFGEIVVLERLASVIGFQRAVEVWAGPERGLHDFESEGCAIEVKASAGAHAPVRIGSLDQLDPSGVRQLALCRVVLVPDDNGLRLSDLIHRVRSLADSAGTTARRLFDQRLLQSGHMETGERDPVEEPLAVASIHAYEVRDTFPRVTREIVPAAVLSADYRLDVTGAQEHLMAAAAFEDLMKRLGGRQK